MITQGLAGAGGQDAEIVFAAHAVLDDDLLQWAACEFVDRLGAEVVFGPVPMFELAPGVVFAAAPGAIRCGAGCVAQLADQLARFGELVTHPGRHDGIAPCDGQPGQCVGQRPGVLLGMGDDCLGCGGTAFFGKQAGEGGAGLITRWLAIVANNHEKAVDPGNALVARGQPMPRKQQIGVVLLHCPQALFLITKYLQGQFSIKQRIAFAADQ